MYTLDAGYFISISAEIVSNGIKLGLGALREQGVQGAEGALLPAPSHLSRSEGCGSPPEKNAHFIILKK